MNAARRTSLDRCARRRNRRAGPRTQRGVALITAVLIVALALILASDVSFKGYLDQRRFSTGFALDQGYQVALGAEAWAADILRRDAQNSKIDDLTEEWATPMPPLPIDGGQIEGYLEDMQGRFNLNSLVNAQPGGATTIDERAVARFRRLLELLELEERWADVIADWLDSDGEPSGFQGAEDNVYTALTPPYRTANMAITRTSELLALAELDLATYRKLEPYVTALPLDARLNVCTALPEVLDAYRLGEVEFTPARDNVAETRQEQGCYPDKQTYLSVITDAQLRQELESLLVEQSAYFRATIWVTIGTVQFTQYSLLYRTPAGARAILRSFGTS